MSRLSIQRRRSLGCVSVVASVLLLLGFVRPIASAAASVSNDDFARATKIRQVPYSRTQETSGATLEKDEWAPCGPIVGSVWFEFTPNANMRLSADTFGSRFDTVVAVFTGKKLETLSPVGCNDNSGGLQSQVIFDADAGETYRLQVGGGDFEGKMGYLQLNLAPPPPPPSNDNFADALRIQALPFGDQRDTRQATLEPDERQPSADDCILLSASVWYHLTLAAPRIVTADTSGSTYNTVTAVYQDTDRTMSGLMEVTCDDNSSSNGVLSRVTWTALPGITYYVQVGASGYTGGGDLILNVN